LILTVLLVLLPGGCTGTGAREEYPVDTVAGQAGAEELATAAPSTQPVENPDTGQARTKLAGDETSLSPRARKRANLPAEPKQAEVPGADPGDVSAPKTEAGVASSSRKSAVTALSNPAQVTEPGTTAGDGGSSLKTSPGAKPVTAGTVAEIDGMPGNMRAPALNPDDESVAAEDGGMGNAGSRAAVSSPAAPGGADSVTGTPARTRLAGVDGTETDPGQASGPEDFPQTAMLPPGSKDGEQTKAADPPKPPGFEERSLDCNVIELMGKAIGRWRRQGDPRKSATDKAINEVLQQTGGVRDRRFVFSGRVYGMLIYRLKQDHTVEGFGAYAQSACLILRGGKGIVPADEASESRLDQALTACESGMRALGELNACISGRMEEIVRDRGAWTG
jgi:hypothetical protein